MNAADVIDCASTPPSAFRSAFIHVTAIACMFRPMAR